MTSRYPHPVSGVKERVRGPKFAEHWNQAQMFYNSLSEVEKLHLTNAISFELDHCDDPQVYITAVQRLNDVDHELAKKVAKNVGAPIPDKPGRPNHGKKAIRISQFEFMPSTPTIKSRRIAIIVADGYDGAAVESMRAALAAGGATTWMIGVRRGPVSAGGQVSGDAAALKIDHHLEGQRSTMFDALFIPGGASHIRTLAQSGRALQWILEAFGHLKVIGAVGEGEVGLCLMSSSCLIQSV